MFSRRQFVGIFAAAAACAVLSFSPAIADTAAYEVVSQPTWQPGMAIPAPKGPIVLRISGKIAAASNGEVAFDLAGLESLGLIRYTTPTNWTESPTTFEGVLLSKVLEAIGADPSATTLTMVALNDYKAPVPLEDAHKWPVMLALKENGKYMTARDHGPIWVVYPQHTDADLGNYEMSARWVWQLGAIDVQ
jgi:hypothetical protein